MEKPLQVFCCYAREDKPSLLVLKKHLRPFQRDGLITVQADIDVGPGEDWEQKINSYLNTAQMILLLISPDFMDSDYCYSKEMMRAMERHESGEAHVIPIILRPTHWSWAPFGKLQGLPTNVEPVSSKYWHTLDDAFFDVAKGIEQVIEKLLILLHPRKIALFGYETQQGNTSLLWANPSVFLLNETYLQWSKTKRSLTEKEIVDQTWVKAGDSGNFSIFHFLPQGLLYESPLLDSTERLQGSWKLINDVLRTNIEQYEGRTLVKYELDIYTNRNGLFHSGIESNTAQTAHAYFVLLPSEQAAKRLEEALTAYNQLLCVNQNCTEAYKARGNILRDLGRYKEALDTYQRAIELKPDYMWAWHDKGDILHKMKHFEEAVAAFDRAIELDGKNARAWHEKGQTLYDLKRYEEALTAYEQAIQVDPNNAWFWHHKGETFRELQQYQAALASYEQALRVDPTFAKSCNGAGNVFYRNLKCYEEAIAAYQRATELDPNYMWAWHNLGNVLHKLRRFEQAFIAYERTTGIDSSNFWGWQNKGDVLHELGHLEEALVAFDQAMKLDPNRAVTWREKGKTLQDLKRYEEALASYERALELEPLYPSIWTRKGEVLRILKRYEKALTAYEKAIKLEADSVDAYLGKGKVYLDLGRYKNALDVYKQATNIAPNNTWVWHEKGVALGYLQRTDEAVGAFGRAIELDPTNKQAWLQRAEAFQQLAWQALQRAYQLTNKEDRESAEALKDRGVKRTAIYTIVSEFSGKVLDVREDGVALIQRQYHGGLSQQWEFIPVGDNFFQIVSCFNRKVLDVWLHRNEDGANIVLHPYLGGANQHWQLVLADSSNFVFTILSQESNKVLDVWNYGKEDGTQIVLFHDLGGTNQHWRLIKPGEWTEGMDFTEKVRHRLGLHTTSIQQAAPSPHGTTGWVQRFTGSSDDPEGAWVYQSKYGAHPTWGEIGRCHERLGGPSGRLGFPTSPEQQATTSPQGTVGQFQRFEDNASVYCSGYGAHPTWGGIGRCYEDLGGTSGPLGFPTSSESEADQSPQGTTGWVQRFEGGDMYWSEAYDGISVREPILKLFEQSGGSGGKFGFPKSSATSDPVHANHSRQEFEGGVIQSF